MNDLHAAGLIMSAIVAVAAWMLGHWERVRLRWPREGPLDRLSDRLRRMGLAIMWLEGLLMAIGSQMPTTLRADRLLFVSIWALVGIVAIVLVMISICDSVVRLMAHRVRSAAIAQVWNQWAERADPDQMDDPDTEEADDTFDQD
ncbi:MAG: hypothetical protein WCJ40_19860 [Planctomycetota bacterium]|nr:hypothetical protein [Planctomycetota bacterium]